MKKLKISGCLFGLLVFAIIVLAVIWFIFKLYQSPTENRPAPDTPEINKPEPPADKETSLNRFLPLGNPSDAVFNQSSPNNYLMQSEYFSLSYNRDKGIPNWVMWRLNKNSFGDAERQNDFRPDNRLPKDWTQVTPSDYTNSGYDRGHLCPSADRSNSEGANSTTFLMTNMTPQTHSMNAGPWGKLESYSRSLARRSTTLYIIAGQYGEKGRIKNKVTIPTNFWKIIVVAADGTTINKDSRIIAVDMPNIDGISDKNWRDYKTTVRQIEQKTGYNFLTTLPGDVQSVLKSKVDTR